MDERRIATRKKSFLKGTVYFNNRRSSLDCLIRDFSDTGARLEFAGPAILPETIELHIPARDETLRCHVRRVQGNEVGVSFENELAEGAGAASGDLGKRVETLEQEFAKLQREFRDFRADLRHKRGED
jgi:hypothetical protein